jgi:hypothetical protein
MEERTAPLKRDRALLQLSREHHHGLLFCWKLRMGIRQNIDPKRIEEYTQFFYRHELLPHFEIEEKLVFPLLGNDHPLVLKALSDHNSIRSLFEKKHKNYYSFQELEASLNDHIRFEERELFNVLQEFKPGEELLSVLALHNKKIPAMEYSDQFWIAKS